MEAPKYPGLSIIRVFLSIKSLEIYSPIGTAESLFVHEDSVRELVRETLYISSEFPFNLDLFGSFFRPQVTLSALTATSSLDYGSRGQTA